MTQYSTDHGWGVVPNRIATGGPIGAHATPFSRHQRVTQHSRPVRVVVADNDPVILDMVATYLDKHNIHVICASGRLTVVPQLAMGQLLAWSCSIFGLRQENGLELLREIRLRSNVAVITAGNPPERSKAMSSPQTRKALVVLYEA